MNACKEDCCYVAKDWAEDVRIAQRRGQDNSVARDYVLPGQDPAECIPVAVLRLVNILWLIIYNTTLYKMLRV